MHLQKNCHKHIWLLSGTGEGPVLAEAFLKKGWRVTVSVVSRKASIEYSHLPLKNLYVGALEDDDAIKQVIEDELMLHLSQKLLLGELLQGGKVRVSVVNDSLAIKISEPKSKKR